jgi:hypothetical protein
MKLFVQGSYTVTKLFLKNKEGSLKEYLIKYKWSIMGEQVSRQAIHTNMQNICLTANIPNLWKKKCCTVLDERIHEETFFMHIFLKHSRKLNSIK